MSLSDYQTILSTMLAFVLGILIGIVLTLKLTDVIFQRLMKSSQPEQDEIEK